MRPSRSEPPSDAGAASDKCRWTRGDVFIEAVSTRGDFSVARLVLAWQGSGAVSRAQPLGERQMRWKIIWVNGGIIAVVTLLSFFLLRQSLLGVLSDPTERGRVATRAVQAADAQLAADAARTERWLFAQSQSEACRGVYTLSLQAARREAATGLANKIRDAVTMDPRFAKLSPSVVLLTDDEGVVLGRDGSELMRGDSLAKAYPGLKRALTERGPSSDLWINPARQEQLLVTYAPIVGEGGTPLGVLVMGTALNDERLRVVSAATSGLPIAFVAATGQVPVARSRSVEFSGEAYEGALQAARDGHISSSGSTRFIYAATPLHDYGASSAFLVAAHLGEGAMQADEALFPLWAIGALGMVLVVLGGVLLGNYVSRPIAEIEEGLLLIMNGRHDLRFDLEHDELGGLTTRLNGLLNSLLGVQEGEGEAMTNPSLPPR